MNAFQVLDLVKKIMALILLKKKKTEDTETPYKIIFIVVNKKVQFVSFLIWKISFI